MPGTNKSLTRKQTILVYLVRIALVVGFIGFWEFASGNLVQTFLISSPTAIFKRFLMILYNGELVKHTLVTFREIVIGYIIGCTSGIAIAFGLGRSQFLSDIFEPFLLAFYGVPRIALAPLFIIWLGIGIWSKVGIVILVTFFFTFFNVFTGMRQLDENYISLSRLMGAKGITITFRVILPAVSPFIILGLKTSIPQAIVGAVVGEFIVSLAGLGYYIKRASELFDTSGLFVGLAVLVVMVIVANGLLNLCEKLVIKWNVQ